LWSKRFIERLETLGYTYLNIHQQLSMTCGQGVCMGLKTSEQRSGHLVIPGERLGVIEEFIPDSGTYVKDGVIYSKIIGRALMDLLNKRVTVYPLTNVVKVPKVSTLVIGQAGNAQSDNVLVRILKIDSEPLSGSFSGILHISDVAESYVNSMNDVCRTGDIIRARVISHKNQIFHLSTAEKTLGVLYAFCSNCGTLLEQKRHEMRCPNCGRVETRKVAMDYGKQTI
jgi:exosome complex component CSL4